VIDEYKKKVPAEYFLATPIILTKLSEEGSRTICLHYKDFKGEGTPRKLATATQPQLFLSAGVEHMSLNGAAQIVEMVTHFPQFALLRSVTYVQLRLITILGNCCCVTAASFLGVLAPKQTFRAWCTVLQRIPISNSVTADRSSFNKIRKLPMGKDNGEKMLVVQSTR
jgi:hypothetical protein